MVVRKICVQEITSITDNFSATVTCTDPRHTPIGIGDDCHTRIYNTFLNPPTLSFSYDAEFEYLYLQGTDTFHDYCIVTGLSGSLTLPGGPTVCCALTPAATAQISCTGVTTTSTYVQGQVSFTFTVSNLCSPTIICVLDTPCI